MLMDLGMKSTSNCGYMHYTIAVSLEMSDEPFFREDILTLPDKYIFYCR